MLLNQRNLEALLRESGITDYPNYPRHCNKRICHIGVGGFHRAHQARYLHSLLCGGDAEGWGIYGIALMPSDRPLLQTMQAQDNLYSLWELEGEQREVRIIGSIMAYIDAIDDREPAIQALCHPETRIVSLTITEKGYCLDASGKLDLSHPAIAADIAQAEIPLSAIGLIVYALRLRQRRGLPGFTIMSCDNLIANGEQARKAVTGLARAIDSDLATWIESQVSFPLSMVDRITPRPNPAIAAQLANSLNFEDKCLLTCESWTQWVLEDDFCNGRPSFELAGVTLTDNVHLYEKLKVGLLNGGHSALSHIGLLLSYRRVDHAASDPLLQRWLSGYMQEIAETLAPLPDIHIGKYRQILIKRFANPSIEDSLFRLAEDTSSKFEQTLLPPLQARLAESKPAAYLAATVALWIYFLKWVAEDEDLRQNYIDARATELIKIAKDTIRTKKSSLFVATSLQLEGPNLSSFSSQVDSVLLALEEHSNNLQSWLTAFTT
ncbi:mannitol dehydrogenase family protein [Zhongshania sp. BJYM1]|uniref:mannitol dehydrogenase family protein n=1 Tax=Zhongshania aquatica TaxID=2965069 RepID=UPI0022B4795C|nr:mannitol dehydrogenase family protein [Marortus sp. BJYM1]